MEDDAPLFVPFTQSEHASFLSALEKIGPMGDLTVSVHLPLKTRD